MKKHLRSHYLLLLCVVLFAGCGGPSIPPSFVANPVSVEEIRAKLATEGVAKQEEEQIEFANQFATLRGTFTLDGDAPPNPILNVNKDLGDCKPGGAPVVDKVVIVDSKTKGLANVLVYAEVPPEWCHETMVNNTDTVEFDQKNCLFIDRIFPMQTTQKLKLLNSDSVGHNAAMNPAKNPKYNPGIPGGQFAMYPPNEDDTLKPEKVPFTISCAAHPWMQSFMIFRDNGYFAVTDEGGFFEIPNLPAGVPIEINVWHEATKGVPGSAVTVQAMPDGSGKWGKRGSFTVNLAPDSQSELNVAVSSSALAK